MKRIYMSLPNLFVFLIIVLCAKFQTVICDENKQENKIELPVNKWVKLPSTNEHGYIWSSPIYEPIRGQILHWGGQDIQGGSRNDVRAFDINTKEWISDYESDKKTGLGFNGNGGYGGMLPSGKPKPSYIQQGVCYDSKREQIIYTVRRSMLAYHPKTKAWTDLGAKTLMSHPIIDFDWSKNTVSVLSEIPGGPPLSGMATCYDPINDEIILFSHFDAKNISMRDATGQISGHYGTFRYSFKENTWRNVSDSFGSEEIKSIRKNLIAIMAKASDAMDSLWRLNRNFDGNREKEIFKQVEETIGLLEKITSSNEIKENLKVAIDHLKALIASKEKTGNLNPIRDALWVMNDVLENKLRVEPPPRCAAPMVYDSKNNCIVMFGGQTNIYRSDINKGLEYSGLDDTWIYEVKTRQWREISKVNRPPRHRVPLLVFDPESGLVLLVNISGNKWSTKIPRKVELWSLDVQKEEWSKRDEQDWIGDIITRSGQGSESPKTQMPADMLGFDVKNRLLMVLQPAPKGQENYVMKLDLSKLSSQKTPDAEPTPPILPQVWDAEDPAWVAKLKSLPANTWVAAKPKLEPTRRDWGVVSVDPVRGAIVYFGGGHSSYQCNNVSVYPVGSNRWSTGVGEHNAFVPPNEWEGTTLGHRGGPSTGHQRNTYQSFDGRMYILIGSNDSLPRNYVFHSEQDYIRLFDLDRGGVWRDMKIANFNRPKISVIDQSVQMVDPKGRLLNIIREGAYNGSPNIVKTYFKIYDINENKLDILEVPKPFPEQRGLGEGRPFCFLSGRNQVFFMNSKPEDSTINFTTDIKKNPSKQVTYIYDIKENKFSELVAKKNPPPLPVQTVEYCESQNCVLAVIKDQLWVYSFDKKDWVEFPLTIEGGAKMNFQTPYGQMVWVEKYGVFMNLDGSTWVMRPDFSQIKWE